MPTGRVIVSFPVIFVNVESTLQSAILVAAHLVKPLGNPPPHSVKYFAASELLEQVQDRTLACQGHECVESALAQ